MSQEYDLATRVQMVREWPYIPYVKAVLGFGLLAVLPFLIHVEVLGTSLAEWLSLKILIITLVWAYAGQAWNLMSGYTGQFSFGHAAFFGIGAYVTMWLLVTYGLNPWLGMLAGGIVAALYGGLIGFLSFRYNVKGHYFALATLAFAELLRFTVNNVQELNAARGYYRPFAREYASGPGLVAFQFNTDLPYYYIVLVFLIFITALAYALKQSSIGYYFFAIREDQEAASSLGIPVNRFKMYGIVVSAFFTAWAGTFWAMYFTTIRPDVVFNIERNVEILLPAIVGGFGTVAGPILGSFTVVPLSEYIRTTFDNINGLHRTVYGLALIIIVLFGPHGISALLGSLRDRILEYAGVIRRDR